MNAYAYVISLNAGSHTDAVRDYMLAHPHTVHYAATSDKETLRGEYHPIATNVIVFYSRTDLRMLKVVTKVWIDEAIGAVQKQTGKFRCDYNVSRVIGQGAFGNVQ